MAACGARYCKQEELALSLHKIAQIVIFDQVCTSLAFDNTNKPNTIWQVCPTDVIKLNQPAWLIQALFLITGFGVWSGQLDMCRGALVNHSLLAEVYISLKIKYPINDDCSYCVQRKQ
jgi:hypothetical protein